MPVIASLRLRTAALSVVAAAAATVMLTAGPSRAALAAPGPLPPEPGIAPGRVSIGSPSAPDTVLAYTATDRSVWLKDLATGAYVAAGGRLLSAPSVISDDGQDMVIFGRGTDSALWTAVCTMSSGCGAWTSLGGWITSKPGAAAEGVTGNYMVFARGAGGTLVARCHSTPFGWEPWADFGGHLLSHTGPSAAYGNSGDGDPTVLVVGTDDQLYDATIGRTGLTALGGRTTVSPALTPVTVTGPSGVAEPAMMAFARGTDAAAWYHLIAPWSPGWHSMGGQFSTGLAAETAPRTAVTPRAPTATFGLGTDHRAYESDGTGASYPPAFTGWSPVS